MLHRKSTLVVKFVTDIESLAIKSARFTRLPSVRSNPNRPRAFGGKGADEGATLILRRNPAGLTSRAGTPLDHSDPPGSSL
jgi:hypothetical protein